MVAEEIIRDAPHDSTARWFFDRVDLLTAAKLIDSENAGYGNHSHKSSNVQKDKDSHTHGNYALGHGSHDQAQYHGQHNHNQSQEVANQGTDHAHSHGHGHGHDHGHNHGHGHDHGHSHNPAELNDRMSKFLDHKLDPLVRWQAFMPKNGGLAEKQELIDTIVKEFGTEHTRITDTLPFLYHFIVFAG